VHKDSDSPKNGVIVQILLHDMYFEKQRTKRPKRENIEENIEARQKNAINRQNAWIRNIQNVMYQKRQLLRVQQQGTVENTLKVVYL